MELHQLRYFESAARLGSMMAAAAECHVSQPAMSVQIRKLEEEAGAPLLLRGARGVRVTPAGERTLAVARRVLRELSVWEGDMRAGAYGTDGPLRVAAQPFLASEILPGPVAETLKSPEASRLRLRERAPSLIPSLLMSGECDLALVDLSAASMEGFDVEVLLKIPYALCVPAGHALAQGDSSVGLARLAEHNVLLYAHAPGLESRLAEAAGPRGFGWEPGFVSEHASAVFELVVAGAGVAVLPAVYSKAALRRTLVVRSLSDYDGQVVVAAVRRRGEALSAGAALLLQNIRRKHRLWATPSAV